MKTEKGPLTPATGKSLVVSEAVSGSRGWREEAKLERGEVSEDRFYSHWFMKLS